MDLVEECMKKCIEVPDYVQNCQDVELRKDALLLLARGVDNGNMPLAKCQKLYISVRAKQVEEENQKEIDLWKQFISNYQ